MAKLQTELYKTKDLAEAAMQIVMDQQLLTIERDGRICWFVFQNKDKCEQLADNYYFGLVEVNARKYHEVLSMLKGRIFSKD